MPLTVEQVARFRAELDARRVEILRRRRPVEIDTTPGDGADRALDVANRERAAQEAEGDTRLLRQIRTRLFELSTGNYGVCVECDEEISLKRLTAVPWTSLCIGCATEAEMQAAARAAWETVAGMPDVAEPRV